jgi:hypothetical protein
MAYKVLKPMIAVLGGAGVGLVGIIGQSASYNMAYIVLAVLAVIATVIITTVNDTLIGRNVKSREDH